jgi:hypothetical protein
MPILRAPMAVTLPRAAAALALLAGLAAVTRLSSWRKPLATDTGQYLYIGDLILDGQTPYVDAANNKGPLTYLLFAAIRLGAGTSMTAVRITLLVFAVLAALALGAYVARFAGRNAGVLAAVAFALFAALPGFQGDDPNTEQIGVALMVGAWWLGTHAGARWALAAGAATAAAILINPAFGVVVPFVAFELWRAQPDPIRARARRIALGVAGGVALAAPIVLWILAAGAFDEMWELVVTDGRKDTDGSFGEGGVPPEAAKEGADTTPAAEYKSGAFAVPERGLWIVGLAGALVACTDRRLRRAAIPAILWVVAGWARVKAADYEYPHHYYPVLPGLVAGLVLGVARVWELMPRGRAVARWAVAAVAIAVPLWVWVAEPEREALDVPADLRWGREFESFALAYPIAEFVRQHTAPDETILVVATDPEVYWLADRHANTPYFDVFPLLERRRRVGTRVVDVIENPPAAIVAMPAAEEADPYFPELLNLHEFPPAFELKGARVWLRKD